MTFSLTPILAQAEPWRTEGTRPPRLAPGPTILETFFEQPLLTAGFAIFLGLILFFVFSRSGKARRAVVAAGVCVAAAAALFALAHVVETDREKVKQRTRDLVDAVQRADMVAIGEMLAPTASGAFYGNTVAAPRDALLERLDNALRQYPVESARITTLEAASRLKGAAQTRTRVVIRVPEATFYDIPNYAWFLIDWRIDASGEWIATRVELEVIEGSPELGSARP